MRAPSGSSPSLTRLMTGLILVSLTGLTYEITLTRIFSVAQWDHFAYMIISMAMFGFAAAGTFLTLADRAIRDRPERLLLLMSGLLIVSLPLCYGVSQIIPFETLELFNQPLQVGYLAVLYLLLSVPFFLVSGVIVICLRSRPERVGLLYSGNLVGSGAGALGSVMLLYYSPPGLIIHLLCVPAVLAFSAFGVTDKGTGLVIAGITAVLVLVLMTTGYQPVRISQYKPLSAIMRSPASTLIDTAYSPVSLIHAVSSPQLRQSPGQISGYPFGEKGELPDQIGLYLDGAGPTVINRADSPANLERFAYLDYVTTALPYKLRSPKRVAVLGAGGGTGLWNALYHGAETALAIEVDPGVFSLMRNKFRDASGQLYHRNDVKPILADARGYFESNPGETVDLIQLSMTKSFATAASGVHALSENYLLTVEAFGLYLNHLNEDGMIAVTRWTSSPPKGSLKLLATMIQAARESGIYNPAGHLAVVRSWNTLTAVLSKSPLKRGEVRSLESFAATRSFDSVYYPGIAEGDVNKYIKLREPIFYESTLKLFESPELFYDSYLYSIRPATDNRPYFGHYFKWSSLNRLVEQLGNETIRYVEWGYLVLLLTLVQAIPLAVCLLLIPLVGSSDLWNHPALTGLTSLYFLLLGFGFMFLEIAYIQIFMKFLSFPVYSVAVVLTGFLCFSGVGSYLTDRYQNTSEFRLISWAVGGLIGVLLAYRLWLETIFYAAAALSDPFKVLFALILLIPLTTVLGVPFPAGLRLVSRSDSTLVPMAWAANGCSSVIGAVLALVIAMQWGFETLILTSAFIYIASLIVIYRLQHQTARG
ncbi:MAG: hypothetical protein ABEK50_12720 [bacterium]